MRLRECMQRRCHYVEGEKGEEQRDRGVPKIFVGGTLGSASSNENSYLQTYVPKYLFSYLGTHQHTIYNVTNI